MTSSRSMSSSRKQLSPARLAPGQSTPSSPHAASDKNQIASEHPPSYLPDVPTLRSPPSRGSSSSSNPSPTRDRPPHGRSRSNPFESLFSKKIGKMHEKKALDGIGGEDSGAQSRVEPKMSKALPHTPNLKTNNSQTEAELIQGRCATCDSTVRWPRHLSVYRCTVCLMVNDLQPLASGNPGSASTKTTKGKSSETPTKGL